MNRKNKLQPYRLVLWVLFGLFVLRVAMQMAVAFLGVNFLPPMEEWYSGVVPYPYLLVSQFMIIGLLLEICREFSVGQGWWTRPNRSLARGLLVFGAVYLLVMIIRYALRMSLYPPERWTGGSIPIFFHWVLASYLLTLGVYHLKHSQPQLSRVRKSLRITFRFAFYTPIVLLIAAWSLFQLGPTLLANKLGFRAPEYAVRIAKDVTFSARDGVRLSQTVFRPMRLSKTPTILVRLPYDNILQHSMFGNMIGRIWAERGYTVVIQGVRGRYLSGGNHDPFHTERDDGLDTLEWLAEQAWFNGKVGMWGASYFGYTQWAIADLSGPSLSAMMVQIAVSDFASMFYSGGAFSLESALTWAVGSRGDENVVPEPDVLQRGFDGWPLIDADLRAVEDIGFFNDWAANPGANEFWQEISHSGRISELSAPVHLMAGWFDPFLQGQLNDYRQILTHAPPEMAKNSALVIGPWAHPFTVVLPGGYDAGNYRLDSMAVSLDWFDEHLSSRKDGPGRAPVRIFVMGKNQWRDEQEWPLKRTKYTDYHLQPGARISTNPPVPEDASRSYIYDPSNPVPSIGGAVLGLRAGTFPQNQLEGRDDVLMFETGPLDDELEVTGPVTVTLYVRTDRTSTDFTAKLVDVHPSGQAYNLSEGIIRKDFTPGETTEIRIDLWPTSNVFLRGHKIRLELSSSNFPRFDRNPNTGGDIVLETNPVKAAQEIFFSESRPSRITLPIIP